jgi:hypothetical protein
LKDLAKAKWYIEREIKRINSLDEEKMDEEYYNAIHRAFGEEGWMRPNAGLKPSEPPKPDSLGRTGNEPLNMDALRVATPATDSLYREPEGEPIYGEPSCYGDRIILGYKPKADNDGWIPWKGGKCPCPGKEVRVKYRGGHTNHGPGLAEHWNEAWLDNNDGWDIVAYKEEN